MQSHSATKLGSLLVGVLLVAMGAAVQSVQAQDAVLSQFYAAPLLLNPGFAGTSYAPTITLNHRSQYVGFASTIPYQTYAVTYGQYIPTLRSGVGISLTADDAGDNIYGTYAATGYYSYQVRINADNSVRLGLSAGLQHRRLDWDRLVFYDQLSTETGAVDGQGNPNPTAEERPGNTSVTFADFGAGVLYAGPKAYAGVSLAHVTTPDDRIASVGPGGFYDGLPMRISVHAGVELDVNADADFFITPNVLYTRQGPFEQLNAGAYASFGHVFAGAWFRHAFGNPDAAIGVIGLDWDMYKFGYSYDATISGLSAVSAGSHEVSLQINFDEAWWVKDRRRNNRYNDCLNLFR